MTALSNHTTANWVRKIRHRYGLSQQKLSEELSVALTTIQNWENRYWKGHIAQYNKEALQYFERRKWMENNVKRQKKLPADIDAIYTLLECSQDHQAQQLAEHLIDHFDQQQGQMHLAWLHHIAGLSYQVSQPDEIVDLAQIHYMKALNLIEKDYSDTKLSRAIQNDILGYQFEAIFKLPKNDQQRSRNAAQIKQVLISLFDKDSESMYLWNALEVVCRTPLSQAEAQDLTSKLTKVKGVHSVQGEIKFSPEKYDYSYSD